MQPTGPVGLENIDKRKEDLADHTSAPELLRRAATGGATPKAAEFELGQPEADSPSWTLRVLAVDASSNEPISGVSLVIGNEAATHSIRATDLNGASSGKVPNSVPFPLLLTARHASMATSSVLLQAVASDVVVRMSPARTIEGRVTVLGSTEAVSEATVTWWAAAYGVFPRNMNLAAEGVPGVDQVPVREDGGFTLHGVDPRGAYQIFAAGNSISSFEPTRFLGTDPFVPVEAGRLFGCRVQLEIAGGGKLQECPDLEELPGVITRVQIPARTSNMLHGHNKPFLPLVGVGSEQSEPFDEYGRLFLFVSDDSSTKIGPIEVQVSLPGYSKELASLYPLAGPASSWPRQTLVLHPLSNGWGGLQATVALDNAYTNHTSLWPALQLQLRNKTTQEYFEVWLKSPKQELFLSPIPNGMYTAYLTIPGQSMGSDAPKPQEFEIRSDFHEVSFLANGLGAVRFDVRREDGSTYDGQLTLRLLFGRSKTFPAVFGPGAYEVACLIPGEYGIEVDFPKSTSAVRPSFRVVVEAGKRAAVELSVP